MYKIITNNCAYSIPKQNIVLLALQKALDNGITQGNIHDDKTAIEYLESIGMKVNEHNKAINNGIKKARVYKIGK